MFLPPVPRPEAEKISDPRDNHKFHRKYNFQKFVTRKDLNIQNLDVHLLLRSSPLPKGGSLYKRSRVGSFPLVGQFPSLFRSGKKPTNGKEFEYQSARIERLSAEERKEKRRVEERIVAWRGFWGIETRSLHVKYG